RLDEMRAEAHERPALAERPSLLVHAGKAPPVERLHRPFGRLLNRRRSGEPRTVDVAQPRDVIHHLRMRQPFVANATEHLEVELLALRDDASALAASARTRMVRLMASPSGKTSPFVFGVQRPVHRGLRFSRNAATPPRKSSLV